ncbi:unnamed protein product [Nippostrongylus brasiliensis]|uniref:MARVEL domain-containing protein n=1 Tax=Nippostrongylus brasiliensis TaxID=27835 RepID=A0A0N4Y347_NIPBR|nr:unnamed protein product [Nippostrongylus brasiliensis]
MKRQIRKRFLHLRDGYDSLEDEDNERRPVSVNSSVLKEAIELDPRQTSRELAAQFGISFASLVFAVISVGIMFVSLYFKYSPMCLKLLGGMADVAYMTVVCSFNLVSFFALLLASILYLDTATRTGIDSPLEKTGKLDDSKACTVSTISQEV